MDGSAGVVLLCLYALVTGPAAEIYHLLRVELVDDLSGVAAKGSQDDAKEAVIYRREPAFDTVGHQCYTSSFDIRIAIQKGCGASAA